MSLPQTYILIQDGDNIIELQIEHTENMAPGVAEAIKKQIATRVLWERNWAEQATPPDALLAEGSPADTSRPCMDCGAEVPWSTDICPQCKEPQIPF